MPKIPLYNRGLGPAVGLATGSLSARASGAFEAQGRAAAQLASQAGQVAFQFGMAEKNEQTQRKSLEYNKQALDESAAYLRENTDTETESFKKGYGQFETTFVERIQNDDSMTSSQKSAVINKVTGTLARQGIQGQQEAYNRGLIQKGQLMVSTLESNRNTLAALDVADPQYKRIVEENAAIYEDANLKGIKLGITQDKYYRAVENDRMVMSTTVALQNNDLDRIDQLITETNDAKGDISATQFSNRHTLLRKAKKEIQLANYNESLGVVQSGLEDMTGQEGQDFAEDLREGKSITVDTPDGPVVIDPAKMGSTNSLALATKIEALTKEKYDKEGEGFVQDLIEVMDSGTGPDALALATEMLSTTNRDADGNVELQVEAATQIINDIENKVETGDISAAQAREQLAYAESLLSGDMGFGAPSQRIDSVGNTAATQLGQVAKLRDDINDAMAAAGFNTMVANTLDQGGIVELTANQDVKPKDIQAGLATLSMKYAAEENPQGFYNKLNLNNVTFDPLATQISQGINFAQTNVDFSSDDIDNLSGLFRTARTFKEMGGNIFENHIKDKGQRQFINAVFKTQDSMGKGLEEAIKQVKAMEAMPEAQMQIKRNKLEASFENVKEKFTNVGFLGFGDRRINNGDQIAAIVKSTANDYLKITGNVDTALELAEKDISMLYTLSGNQLIRKTTATNTLETAGGGMDQLSVQTGQNFVERHREIAEEFDLEPEDFSLVDTTGTGEFTLFVNGQPAILLGPDVGAANTRFKTEDLLIISKSFAEEAEAAVKAEEIAESKENVESETQAKANIAAAEDDMFYTPDDMTMKGAPNDSAVLLAIGKMIDTTIKGAQTVLEGEFADDEQQGIISETGE